MRIKTEPALAVAVLQAVVALGVSFGLQLKPEQIGAIAAVAAAVSALFVRQRVTPLALAGAGPAAADPVVVADPAPDPEADPSAAEPAPAPEPVMAAAEPVPAATEA